MTEEKFIHGYSTGGFASCKTTRAFSVSNASPFSRGDLGRNTFRSAAMTLIFKGVKDNDVSKIIGKPQNFLFPHIRKASHSLNPEGQDILFDKKQDIHNNLTSIRKRLDELKSDNFRRERELQSLREENKRLIQTESDLKNKIQNSHNQEKQLDHDKNYNQKMYQDAYWQRSSYKHIRNRLNQDQIAFQIKLQNMQHELDFTLKRLSCADTHQQDSKQFTYQAQQILDEMMKNIEFEHRSREEQLLSFKENINSRQVEEKVKEDRTKRQNDISEHAIYDKDTNEKNWRKLILVHKFLSTMFKDKMKREMEKFEKVEKAYQKIKQATGVQEAEDIVSKFLTREQTYGELLASIADYEKRIENLKKKQEESQHQLEELKQDYATMESLSKKSNKNTKSSSQENHYIKKIDSMDDKAKKTQLSKETFYQWCIKLLIKSDRVNTKQILYTFQLSQSSEKKNYFEIYPRTQQKDLFAKVCEVINSMVKNKEQADEILLSSLKVQDYDHKDEKTANFLKKNTRIKPVSNKRDMPIRDQSSKKSDSMTRTNSFVDSDSEADEENEFGHVDILRNGLKYEEELQLKKKYEEERKKHEKLKPKENKKKNKKDPFDEDIMDEINMLSQMESPKRGMSAKSKANQSLQEPQSPIKPSIKKK